MRDDQAGIGAMRNLFNFKMIKSLCLIVIFSLLSILVIIPVQSASATTCYYANDGTQKTDIETLKSSLTGGNIGGAYVTSNTCASTVNVLNSDSKLIPGLQAINASGPITGKYTDGLGTATGGAPFQGFQLGSTTSYWNGTEFVSDGTTSGCAAGYLNGFCGESGSASAGIPLGFDGKYSAPTKPGGTQVPMCVNVSPIVGYGVGIVGGIVVCNTGFGKMSHINAYNANDGWDGINLNSLWANGTITSYDTMTSYGGAQLFSPDGNTGLIVQNDEIYMRSKSGSNLAEFDLTPGEINASVNNSTTGRTATINLTSTANSQPALSIYGKTGNSNDVNNTSVIGVQISGSGQSSAPILDANNNPNGQNYVPVKNVTPNWADVLISSASYYDNVTKINDSSSYQGQIDLTAPYTAAKGSAIIVTDYGVQIVTPTPGTGATISNTMFANNGGGTVVNNFGNDPNGIQGTTINNFGNRNSKTELNLTAANSTTTIQNGVNTSSLGGADTQKNYGTGGSVLDTNADTSSLSGAVLKGTKSTDVAIIDPTGKIRIVNAGSTTDTSVAQTTAMMTVTNGINNVHGFVVNEQQATMSGGTRSTSFTLNDGGATFQNVETGGPARVHGVADGITEFDAVNVRQLYGAVSASMATVPNFTVEPGETGIGFGTAMMGSYPAVGMAFAKKNKNGSQINIGVAAAQNVPLAVRAGVGWVW